jgi:hypothetical protein
MTSRKTTSSLTDAPPLMSKQRSGSRIAVLDKFQEMAVA